MTQLHDSVVQTLVEQIEYDYSKFDSAKMSEIRCGLNVRCERTVGGEKEIPSYSLDLPETINQRRHFIIEVSNETYISESLFDTGRMGLNTPGLNR